MTQDRNGRRFALWISKDRILKADYPAEKACGNVRSDNREIYCVIDLPPCGEGPYPTLLLAHGYGGSLEDNLNCSERYASAGFAVCSLDFCGGSYLTKSSGTTMEMSVLTEKEDMLLVFGQLLKLPFVKKDAVFLWGESLGGVVAALCAAELREKVRALVLFYPAFVIFDDVRDFFADYESITDMELWEVHVGAGYFRDLWGVDPYKEIAGYSGPVLLLHGTEDDLVPMEYSEKVLRIYPDVTYRTIEGAGHGFFEKTGEYADEIVTGFLRELMKKC